MASELRSCEGINWMRRELASLDWSELDWITARRVNGRIRETRRGTEFEPISGVCNPPRVSLVAELNAGYRINARVSRFCGFPTATRSGQTIRDENEAFVWVIAHEAAHYLFSTGQLPGENTESECDADAMLAKYRGDGGGQ